MVRRSEQHTFTKSKEFSPLESFKLFPQSTLRWDSDAWLLSVALVFVFIFFIFCWFTWLNSVWMNARTSKLYLSQLCWQRLFIFVVPWWRKIFVADSSKTVNSFNFQLGVSRAISRKSTCRIEISKSWTPKSFFDGLSLSLFPIHLSACLLFTFVMLILIAAFIYLMISTEWRLNLVHCQRGLMKSLSVQRQPVERSTFLSHRCANFVRKMQRATTTTAMVGVFIYLAHLQWYSGRTNRRSERHDGKKVEKSNRDNSNDATDRQMDGRRRCSKLAKLKHKHFN